MDYNTVVKVSQREKIVEYKRIYNIIANKGSEIMKLYLSSYKIGNEKEYLKNWIKKNGNEIVFIANSRDIHPESGEKEEKIQNDILELKEQGFEVKKIDLKKYFGKEIDLKKDLEKYKAFYVIGGNTYALRLAMKYSGFDNFLKEIAKKENYLYAGYSAGICVLSPSLEGLDIVDEPINPYNNDEVIYEGIGLLDFVPVPHYKSDHPESYLVDRVVEYYTEKSINFKTLKDGEVIIFDNNCNM